jgi:hypothetical protein
MNDISYNKKAKNRYQEKISAVESGRAAAQLFLTWIKRKKNQDNNSIIDQILLRIGLVMHLTYTYSKK